MEVAHTNDSTTYPARVDALAQALRKAWPATPRLAVVLGSGLGGLVREVDVEVSIPYQDLPGMPVPTTPAHSGVLHMGLLAGVPALVFQGRCHLYEGYSAQEVALPARIVGAMGVQVLVLTNAAGGLRPEMEPGDLMLVSDHINLQGANPLIGPNYEAWGPRFPDMSEPYDPELRVTLLEAARNAGIRLHEGVYAAVVGPNLETRAEYRFLRELGADAVGMSTVPEVIAARHMGLRTLAISAITDRCLPESLAPISALEVKHALSRADPALRTLVRQVAAGC